MFCSSKLEAQKTKLWCAKVRSGSVCAFPCGPPRDASPRVQEGLQAGIALLYKEMDAHGRRDVHEHLNSTGVRWCPLACGLCSGPTHYTWYGWPVSSSCEFEVGSLRLSIVGQTKQQQLQTFECVCISRVELLATLTIDGEHVPHFNPNRGRAGPRTMPVGFRLALEATSPLVLKKRQRGTCPEPCAADDRAPRFVYAGLLGRQPCGEFEDIAARPPRSASAVIDPSGRCVDIQEHWPGSLLPVAERPLCLSHRPSHAPKQDSCWSMLSLRTHTQRRTPIL